jgi:hypothetical protein
MAIIRPPRRTPPIFARPSLQSTPTSINAGGVDTRELGSAAENAAKTTKGKGASNKPPKSDKGKKGGNYAAGRRRLILDAGDPIGVLPVPASYTSQTTFNMGAGGENARGMTMPPDGLSLQVMNNSGDVVKNYSMDPAYDITTMVQTGTTDDGLILIGTSLEWNGDGSRMYYIEPFTETINYFACPTAYDITSRTAPGAVAFDVTTEITGADSARGLSFGNNGLKLYVGTQAETNDKIQEYDLSPAYDVSTATPVGSLDVSSVTSVVGGIVISGDGNSMYLLDSDVSGTGNVYQIDLATQWDISSGTINTVDVLAITGTGSGKFYDIMFEDGAIFVCEDFSVRNIHRMDKA